MPDTEYYFSSTGQFLGGFIDGAIPPDGAVLYGITAPMNGLDTWLNGVYTSYVPTPTLNDQLFGLYSTLSPASQILYAPYVATIKLFIDQGQLSLAKTIVSGIVVSPEDQTVQQQMGSLLS
jgi:hypothetical protein